MSNESVSSTETKPLPTQPIIARAGKYFRNMRYLIVAMCLVMGGAFLYDGFVRYPNRNAKIAELTALRDKETDADKIGALSKQITDLGKAHDEGDLKMQKTIGGLLPIVGIALLVYWLHKSRGEYRLENDVLSVPGHPPVPLAAIQSLDTSLWERKGIARLQYKTAQGEEGSIILDDFVYERKPIDDIYDVIVAGLKTS